MTWVVLLFLIAASVSGAPTDSTYNNQLKTIDEESTASAVPELLIKLMKNQKELQNEEDPKSSSEDNAEKEGWISPETNQQLTTDSAVNLDSTESNTKSKNPEESKDKKSKKGRKHKALFIDYPFLPQLSAIPNFEAYDDLGTEERTPGGGGRKRYQESNIYYIRLPPTPYMFVPGLGYVSQPPNYSTGPTRPQISHVRPHVNPYRPHAVYNTPLNDINPFINLPLDFVSNGKPTSVYQWQSPAYQPIKRPESQISTLDKGPYFFNGRPHGIYLLRPDARPPVHQSLQFPDYQDTAYY